jgi:hypothetical protein
MSFSEVVVTQHWVTRLPYPVEMRVEAIHHDVLEPCELRALVEKRESARLHARAPVLRGRMVGEHDEADLRRGRVHGAEHVDAGAARQPEVEDDAVRRVLKMPATASAGTPLRPTTQTSSISSSSSIEPRADRRASSTTKTLWGALVDSMAPLSAAPARFAIGER